MIPFSSADRQELWNANEICNKILCMILLGNIRFQKLFHVYHTTKSHLDYNMILSPCISNPVSWLIDDTVMIKHGQGSISKPIYLLDSILNFVVIVSCLENFTDAALTGLVRTDGKVRCKIIISNNEKFEEHLSGKMILASIKRGTLSSSAPVYVI